MWRVTRPPFRSSCSCVGRPEFLERKTGLGPERWSEAPRCRLEPLDEAASDRLIAELLGEVKSLDVRARIAETAEGNPLFIEQMISMLIDEGLLVEGRRPMGCRRPASTPSEVPPGDRCPAGRASRAPRRRRTSGDREGCRDRPDLLRRRPRSVGAPQPAGKSHSFAPTSARAQGARPPGSIPTSKTESA